MEGRLSRLTKALLGAFVVSTLCGASTRAADIRNMYDTRTNGQVTTGSFGFVLEGTIAVGDFEKLKNAYGDVRANQFLIGSPGFNWLYLASPGGDLAEAIKIGRFVRALKLETIIPSRAGPKMEAQMVEQRKLRNPKANYACASACFFIFVAGIKRTFDEPGAPLLGIHRPYLSDSNLRSLTGDQAINSAYQVRTTIEGYLKEMNVPAKYAEAMFAVPKDAVRWISETAFRTDFDDVIPPLKEWLGARCDKLTDVEKLAYKQLPKDRPIGQFTPNERAIFDALSKKRRDKIDCELNALDELSGQAWLQMFDPTCRIVAPEARTLEVISKLCRGH